MRKNVLAGALMFAATALWATSPGASLLWFGKSHKAQQQAPVVMAQAADSEMRVQQLEEQLRQLNGRVEEMSFQLLQMQEQLRKTQEDNEFRFEELEGGGKPKKKSSLETPAGSTGQDTANASGELAPGAQPADKAGANASAGQDTASLDQPVDGQADPDPERPPAALGTLNMDDVGNVISADKGGASDGVTGESLPPITGNDGQSDSQQTASLETPASGDDAQYQSAYQQVLSGDYRAAETGFTKFIAEHPESKRIADANFWLGEAQYSQGKYTDSAKTFLNAYKTYGKSPKAPEMLLKLAMSLAALDSKDTACATLREVSKAYPKTSRAIISKVATEQKRLAC